MKVYRIVFCAIKILIITILSLITIFLCFIIVLNIIGYRSDIVSGVTGDKIKEVKIGMSLNEVLLLLGKPYEIEVKGEQHNLNCKTPKLELAKIVTENTDIICIVDNYFKDTVYCCEGYKEAKQIFGENVTLAYTKPIQFCEYYPMLWIHFDSNYCVCDVYAKRYDWTGLGDICIYELAKFIGIDSTNLKEMELKPFINEDFFDKCFPR